MVSVGVSGRVVCVYYGEYRSERTSSVCTVYLYTGHALSWDDIIIEGNPQEYTFAAYYVKGNKVLAVCSMNMDPVVATSAELMYRGKMPPGDEIR